MDLLSGLTSVLSGGVTGLIGSVAQRVFEYKTKKLEIELQKEKFSNEQALRKLDAEIMSQEWAARTKVAQVEGEFAVEKEDAKAFAAALTSEPKLYHEGKLTNAQNWLMVVLDFVRGTIRPGLTIYLCALTTAIYIQAKMVMGHSVAPDQAYELVDKIVQTVLYLTTTCVLFWFGTRNEKKK